MSHNINTITIEANTAKPLVDHPGEKPFATVFAIHNRYMGRERDEKAVPMNVLFSGPTYNLAKKTLNATGVRFVVSGIFDADTKEGTTFYTIRAESLSPLTKKPSTEGEE